jgi:hypothetical protein
LNKRRRRRGKGGLELISKYHLTYFGVFFFLFSENMRNARGSAAAAEQCFIYNKKKENTEEERR